MAWFREANFEGEAWFGGASFEQGARFHDAKFHRQATFGETSFQRHTDFSGTHFNASSSFDHAVLKGEARFDLASFQGDARFLGTSFHGQAEFGGARFQGEALFREASFNRAARFGPLLARQLVLDGAVFGDRVELAASAAAICARRARFPNGVHMRLRFASVVLDDADLAAPAIIAGAPAPFPELEGEERKLARAWQRMPPGPRERRWRPRLLSLRRTDVAGLRLADVDLRACRFIGAHNLDRLRLEGAPLFARTAGWWRARRRTLAEEQHWRAGRSGRWRSAHSNTPACQPVASRALEAPEVPDRARLAALYRDLHKGREDAKDEPGAADFYDGECEMRRHDSRTPMAERLVLGAYWLVSGYGLRAWRAPAALTVVVLLAGVMLALWGFPTRRQALRQGWDDCRRRFGSAPGPRRPCCVVRTAP